MCNCTLAHFTVVNRAVVHCFKKVGHQGRRPVTYVHVGRARVIYLWSTFKLLLFDWAHHIVQSRELVTLIKPV